MDQHGRTRGTSVRSGMLLVLVAVGSAMLAQGPLRLIEPAVAQIPDSGLQRKQLLDEAKRANQLLSEIKQLLATMARDGSGAGSTKKTAGRS